MQYYALLQLFSFKSGILTINSRSKISTVLLKMIFAYQRYIVVTNRTK